MTHVYDISKRLGMFECYSDMADYDYIVEVQRLCNYDTAKEIAERELCRWGVTEYCEDLWDSEEEYKENADYYYNAGYVEVVANALAKAGIVTNIYVKWGENE